MAKGRGEARPSSFAKSNANGRPSAAAALLVTNSVTHITKRKSSASAPEGGNPAAWTAPAATPERPEVCTACAKPKALPIKIRRDQSTVSRTSPGRTQPPSMQKTESVTATRTMERPAKIVSERPTQKATRGSKSMRVTGGGMPAIRLTRRKSALVSFVPLGASTRALSPMVNRWQLPMAACLSASRASSSLPVGRLWMALELTTDGMNSSLGPLSKKDFSLTAPSVKRSDFPRSEGLDDGLSLIALKGLWIRKVLVL
mmetsp:Transcript_8423/g.22893  ORF Transcript_8423/g.22893 Transcript_8423/m.22893 type:complete len:258 (+) Transcript_8423:269-1042(+)